jgi:hypothetical protein
MNRLTAFAGFTALLLSPLVSAPAATAYPLLWGESQLSQRQERYQRGQGWSSGDYFGSAQAPSRNPGLLLPYQPGMQNNIHYMFNSCSRYVGC